MARDPIVEAFIRRGARARGLDENAVLAIASVEGGIRRGAVGDQGTSGGPFQLHIGGALPRGRSLAWASSPAGINYALDRIAGVARGLRGRQAVSAISSRFERPANVPQEIQRAMGVYGPGGGPVPVSGPVMGPRAPFRMGSPSAGLGGLDRLVNATNRIVGLPELPMSLEAPQVTVRPPAGNANVPNPPKFKRGRTINFLSHFAAPYGLTITSTTGGKHAKNSYHYRGRAVDFGGDSRRLAALARAALSHPADFVEAIYTGPGSPGYSILGGKVVPNSQLDRGLYDQHTTHVHLAR